MKPPYLTNALKTSKKGANARNKLYARDSQLIHNTEIFHNSHPYKPILQPQHGFASPGLWTFFFFSWFILVSRVSSSVMMMMDLINKTTTQSNHYSIHCWITKLHTIRRKRKTGLDWIDKRKEIQKRNRFMDVYDKIRDGFHA